MLLTFYSAHSQNLAGTWQGYLNQSEAAAQSTAYQEYWKKGSTTHALKLTLEPVLEKKQRPGKTTKTPSSYTGEYYINETLQPAHFARFSLEAQLKNKRLAYKATTKLFEVKNSLNEDFCYSSANLSYSQDEYYEYLIGDWKGWDEKDRACAAGKVLLRRLLDPNNLPPTPEPALPVVEPLVETVSAVPTVEPVAPAVVEVPVVPVVPSTPSVTLQHYDQRSKITKEVMTVAKDSISIDVWDGNREDGDIISLVFNGVVLLEQHTLTKEKRQFRVALQKGQNILTLIAHNLGDIPPNTAALEVERNDGRKKITLSSDMDRSESVLIIRD